MKVRIITALIGLPLLIGIVYLGGWVMTVAVYLVSLVALTEYVKAINKSGGSKLNTIFLGLLTIILLTILKMDFYAVIFGLLICFILVMTYEVFSSEPSFIRACQSLFFLIYIPIMFGSILLFETFNGGKYMIWLCFIAPFATDTFAYFGGRKIGGKKLTTISPNKTISGSICGFLACALLLTGYGWILQRYFSFSLPLYYYFILGAVASIVGQIGDISASLIKRTYDVKDFGKLLPGHGGILDRFDSVIFTIPIFLIFTYYFIS